MSTADLKYLQFKYTNWKGERYTYIIDPEPESLGFYEFPVGDTIETHWVISGDLIVRDNDPRPELNFRRRTFKISEMEEIREIPWFPPRHFDYRN